MGICIFRNLFANNEFVTKTIDYFDWSLLFFWHSLFRLNTNFLSNLHRLCWADFYWRPINYFVWSLLSFWHSLFRLNTNFLSNIASILQGKPVQRDFLWFFFKKNFLNLRNEQDIGCLLGMFLYAIYIINNLLHRIVVDPILKPSNLRKMENNSQLRIWPVHYTINKTLLVLKLPCIILNGELSWRWRIPLAIPLIIL
jgi:hypothetical protein